MDYPGNATVIGLVGVSLLLLAFFLNLFKFLRSESYVYMILNLVGGTLACYSSYLINFMPFVVLEGTWAVVAAVGVGRKTLAGSAHARGAGS
jgi:hypothetical protein